MIDNTQHDLDDAITAHIKNGSDVENLFVTGWTLVASVSSSEIDTGSQDGYVMINSEGLAHHTVIGLLTVALQDRNNMSMINMLGQADN
jgi:hypothetical protein